MVTSNRIERMAPPLAPRATNPDKHVRNEKKKKSIFTNIFGKRNGRGDGVCEQGDVVHEIDRRFNSVARKGFQDPSLAMTKSFSERRTLSSRTVEGLDLNNFGRTTTNFADVQDFRIFVGTWNVGGRSPSGNLNLEHFLQVEGSSDIYVVGFQEVVPLNAGNVLVIEDNEPATKWVSLIHQALNRPCNDHTSMDEGSYSSSDSGRHSKYLKSPQTEQSAFQKSSLKTLARNLKMDNVLKMCNCSAEALSQRRRMKEFSDLMSRYDPNYNDSFNFPRYCFQSGNQFSYSLVASKQMVGIYLSVWARSELVPHIGHLRMSCIGRGIMGYLGNKGCISVSMTIHQTSFCFICSHLASGEKEGDELRRNSDVAEVLKTTQFPKICKRPRQRIPERILEHDRIIWLGDLNYRIALSYEEARVLLEEHDWEALLEKDQLKVEKDAGRVFQGWREGRIYFAPTYKYSQNSDAYAGETEKSKKKRRTPAWCDRILWYGEGLQQLSYIRGESRFSDHRPVCAVFMAEVEVTRSNRKAGYEADDNDMPMRHSFYDEY